MSQTNPVLNGSLRRLKHLKFTSFVWDMSIVDKIVITECKKIVGRVGKEEIINSNEI
ncbi:hypothetical protein C1645_838652 [Glomus cerebriforme]|uniref:Uncharacterized protein n=1 Tax=Glomus cerebriforme TaxID=658196 RepID=A0A397S3B8_9GLOM|nr:hypothetical protein C1645_838652 [Glomus cerebriforme]